MRKVRNFIEAVVAVLASVVALGCASMAVWALIRIVFYTLWLTLTGLMWVILGSVAGAIALWLFERQRDHHEAEIAADDTFQVVWNKK